MQVADPETTKRPDHIEPLRYRDAYLTAQAELAELRSQVRPNPSERDRMKREIVQLKSLVSSRDRTIAAQARELQAVRKRSEIRIAGLEARILSLGARLSALQGSTWWRLTAPLRRLTSWAKGLHRNRPSG